MSKVGDLFGGGEPEGTNDELIRLQREQMRIAREREEERQQRLAQGLAQIRAIFEGGTYGTDPVTGAGSLDPSGQYYDAEGNLREIDPDATRTVNRRVLQTVSPTSQGAQSGGAVSAGHLLGAGRSRAGGPSSRYVRRSVTQPISPQQQLQQFMNSGGGLFGGVQESQGFGDDFYGDFRQANLDVLLPQLQDAFERAREQATFALSRAGLLRSSAGAETAADLERQRQLGEADVRRRADTAVSDLRQNVNAARKSAVNQLYSTENPEVAANFATTSVQNLRDSVPNPGTLGQIFAPLAIGAGNFLQGRREERLRQELANPRNPQQSSGRTF